MAVPAFEFTHRAIPVVQMGRSARGDTGNRWQEGVWGAGLWGVRDWEVLWTDLTCEVHEITTDVGRGGATDRFVPGTAAIVASNVNQLSEMIFPPVPETGTGFDYIPQPPIENEETLQAPDADTVTSNGWSFSDDFETAPPRWVFPAAWATTGTAPYGPFKLVDEGWEPELYRTGTNYVGNGAAQYTRSYDPAGNSSIGIVITNVGWPVTPSSGTPELVVDLMLRGNTTDKQCDVVKVRIKPIYGGAPNQIFVDLKRMNPDGTTTTLSTTPQTTGTGTGGVFGTVTVTASLNYSGGLTGVVNVGATQVASLFTTQTALAGTRIGFAVHYEQGALAVPPGAPHIESVALIDTVTGDDQVDDLTRRLGAGWTVPDRWRRAGYQPMLQDGGAMIPDQTFVDLYNGQYVGAGLAQWTSDFEGDQFCEIEVTNISKPRPNGAGGGTAVWFHLYLHSNPQDLTARVVRFAYDPGYGTTDNKIWWQLWTQGPNEEETSTTTYGEINLGDTDGVFPEPDRIRVESDLTGQVRLYRQGTLLQTVDYTDAPAGGRVGVYTQWEADNLFPNSLRRPDVARIEQVWAGLQSPLGTEELGLWVRIGVDHDVLGTRWLFRGFVDEVVPTYVPDRQDAVRIGCIDSLGEAGRVQVDQFPNPMVPANGRIRQILNGAHWPQHFRTLEEDATVMSRPRPGKAVDVLTLVAESCGGAVYGDPETGHVVFKGQDWQGRSASSEPEAFITNYRPDVDDGIPRICPSGWERSSKRQDMNTRVRFTTETSHFEDGHPIVKEWAYLQAEQLYGVELYERTLICTTAERVNELANRQLRLRNPNQFPRIEAVTLDASTGDDVLDLMTTATFTKPSKYWCQHRENGAFVFNRRMLVTGVRHRMTPTRWTCRLALDPSSVFYERGARWGEGRWDRDDWGHTR